ncbi:MAG: right-handed parallel beta-helix repeat-containing protein, partial [Actinomycetia bacterium]|nr:right-handed parallel beta-helix repeat-containing protein [Actinomycetes bacterium]
MKYKTPLVALALSLVAATSQLSASDKYVDSAAGGSNNGSDWTNAYIDLQAALTAAKAPGSGITRICIAGGTYKPSVRGEPDTPRTETFQLINGVMIMGGYRGSDGGGDPNDRDIEAYETILSGDIGVEGDDSDNCYHVFCHDRIGLDNTAVLDGVTISGGNADGAWPHQNGGGMYNRVCSPELIDCEFTKNAATVQGGAICNYLKCSPEITGCSFSSNSSGEKGGAVYNHNGDDCAPEFFKCTFSGNTSLHGGAMFNSEFDGSPLLTITDCVFDSNSCGGLGGGIRNQQTSPIITNCIFSGNSSDDGGGGVFNYDNSNPTLTNCTFTGNEATDGGAMLSSSNCTPVVINCTIVGNSADDGGGGLHSVYNSTTTVVNSILWDNTATTAPQISGAAAVTYSCVEDGYTGTGNIVTDPLFVDADGADNVFGTADDDLHIENDSPCIDAGDNAVVPSSLTMDFEGAIRIQEDTVDMGADETPNYVVPWDTWPVIPIPDDIDTSKDDTLAVALIPRQSGMAFCGCPHCDSFGLANDLFDWAIPSLGGYTHESVINGWVKNHKGLMANLDHIRCKNCGRVYPRDCAGEDFPTDYTLGSNPLPANSMAGFTEQDPVPYYYKTGEAEGSRCYFEGTVWYKQKQWLAVRAAQYVIRANLPEIDDDARKWYARQAALIIYEFATAFPEYRVTVQARTAGDSLEYLDLEYVDGTVVSIDRGNSARFSYWVYKNVSVELAKAYYGILDVDIWNDLATDLNTTASHIHCQIQRQFFKPCVEEVLHRIDCESFQDKLMYGNMTGYMMSGIAWAGRSFAVCGAGTPPIGCSLCTGIGVGCDGLNPNPCNAETIIDTHVGPTYVHRAYEWLRRTTTDKNRFLFDGIWPEAASYHMQALIHIGFVVEALDQYNGDPNGYSYEPGHPTFPTSQPCDPNREFQLRTLTQGAMDVVADPNSLFCPIGYTWPTDHLDFPSGVESIEVRPMCGNL